MAAYYNEIDPYAAQWLRNLIAKNLIAPGDVDERSIVDVRADDLKQYTQCHFFAGIGGWSIALRQALWADDRYVWTGSCPCQPFSVAGKRNAQEDERHLWPEWFRLIRESKPPVIFGEQVTGALSSGWGDEVSFSLEKEGYAFGAAVLPACSVEAPHQRNRFWFVAHALREGGRIQQVRSSKLKDKTDSIYDGKKESLANSQSFSTRGLSIGKEEEESRLGEHDSFMADSISERGCSRISEWEDAENVGEPSRDKAIGFWDVEPSVGRVANGIFARSHKLRAYGNAIVPQVAAEFIKAAM